MDNLKELKAGDVLQGGIYHFERTIYADDFGITYMAKNTLSNVVCVVKEFFINDYCVRNANGKTCRFQVSPVLTIPI
jgi:hypothetical protein